MRVRQHVNPLSTRNMEVVPPPLWAELFPSPALPLVLDLGCGSGRFLLALGGKDGERARNHLGVEIRAPLAVRADGWAKSLTLPHVRFLATNANVNVPTWLADYPGPLALVSILHPDPHWCARHAARLNGPGCSSHPPALNHQEDQAPQAPHRAACACARAGCALKRGRAAVSAVRREGCS